MNRNKINITSIIIIVFIAFVIGTIIGMCMQPVQAAETTTVVTTESTSVVETTTEATTEEATTECTTESTTVYIAPSTTRGTTTEIPLTTIKFEDIPEYEELGTYKLTAYCSCSSCCGKSDGITASGTKAQAGRTVATSSSIPFGTELYINGNTYVVEDRGVGEGVVDIYFDSHSDAMNFGVKYAKVFEVVG
jgi:3D (Asp-Asp-Asp) domain-containing protein